jgi:CubicO group peptidase (beta-lactamase class C family)
VRLNDRVRHWIDSWTGEERQIVTLRDLLEHASGLPAHRKYYQSRRGRASFELAICEEPLDYPPRTQSLYSDPGFMLLGFAIENAAGRRSIPNSIAGAIASSAPMWNCAIGQGQDWFDRIAPTENTPDGDVRRGEVHDENAAALGGVAAHAGLFGSGRRGRGHQRVGG